MQAADHATANHMVNKRLAAGIQMRRIFMAVENAHARAAVALRAPEGPAAPCGPRTGGP